MSVYVIRCTTTGLYKIGFSVDPNARLLELQVGSTSDLVLVGVREGSGDLERALHRQYASRHVRGEWFRLELQEVLELLADPARDGVPEVCGVLSADGVTVSITCPYCGKKHTHGAAGITDAVATNHRGSHCTEPGLRWTKGYYIRRMLPRT